MNTIKLNTIGTPKVSAGNSGGSSSASNWKYYDCLLDQNKDNTHAEYYVDNVKVVDLDTGNVLICPEAYMDSETAVSVAVAMNFDETRKVYMDGKWVSLKEFWENPDWEGFDFSTHPEITEEEFYHIPEEEIWNINSDQQSRIEAFNKLFNLASRYKIDKLSLYPFYKRLVWEDCDTWDCFNLVYVAIQQHINAPNRKALFLVNDSSNCSYIVMRDNVVSDIEGLGPIDTANIQINNADYDATYYEDRKALWKFVSSFNLGVDEDKVLDSPITLANSPVSTGIVTINRIANVFGDSIVLYNDVEALLIRGDKRYTIGFGDNYGTDIQ